MAETKRPSPLVRADDPRRQEQPFSHPLNPASEAHGIPLSHLAGLSRIGVHVIRVPGGREAMIYHSHTTEEEFFYVLSGRGIAEIDGEEHPVGPGDFMGFPTPSVAHHLRNPHDEDLVYLVGGERREVEVATFPHLKRRVVRVGMEAWVADEAALMPFWKAADESD